LFQVVEALVFIFFKLENKHRKKKTSARTQLLHTERTPWPDTLLFFF
jgi:hypothetical protein